MSESKNQSKCFIKMLTVLWKSLNVLLSRMYNVLSTINQEATLFLGWRAQSGSFHSKGPRSRSLHLSCEAPVLVSLMFFFPALRILAQSV